MCVCGSVCVTLAWDTRCPGLVQPMEGLHGAHAAGGGKTSGEGKGPAQGAAYIGVACTLTNRGDGCVLPDRRYGCMHPDRGSGCGLLHSRKLRCTLGRNTAGCGGNFPCRETRKFTAAVIPHAQELSALTSVQGATKEGCSLVGKRGLHGRVV